MEKSLKTVVMPDGSSTQIISSKAFTHAVIFYNPFYDGWTVKRWEESRQSAEDTYNKQKDKKMKEFTKNAEKMVKRYWILLMKVDF